MVSTNRVKAYLALAGAFVLGGVVAGAGYHAYATQKNAELFAGDREAIEARRVEVMSRELGLSSEQEAQVRELFRRHAPERRRLMREAMQSCGAAMSAHRERLDAEIRALLDAEQRVRFEALRAERKRKLELAPEAPPRAP